jgi:hypothetical protein
MGKEGGAMNNIVANFDQIIRFGQDFQAPVEKKRGIVREYLQSKFLVYLYGDKKAKGLSFVGGTSLRLLFGLPRFSEDLDFDNLGLTDKEIRRLVEQAVMNFKRENIEIEMDEKVQAKKTYFSLKFPRLLHDLMISTNPKEKLRIKFDYADVWQGQTVRPVLFNRYGLIEEVLTNIKDQILVQKLTAYVNRVQTQPRDMYDVVWLYAQGARPDKEFMKKNKVEKIIDQAKKKLNKEGIKSGFKKRLAPFLFREEEVEKVNLFGKVLSRM